MLKKYEVTAYAMVHAHKKIVVVATDPAQARAYAGEMVANDSDVCDGWTVMSELAADSISADSFDTEEVAAPITPDDFMVPGEGLSERGSVWLKGVFHGRTVASQRDIDVWIERFPNEWSEVQEEIERDGPELRFDWFCADNAEQPHAGVYRVRLDGDQGDVVAVFYGDDMETRAEAEAARRNAEPV